MATATPHLFNSTPFAVIAELLYRRTGLLVTSDQVETSLVSTPGIESVTNSLIGYGDGATTLFAPLINNVPIMNSFAVSAVRVTTVDGTTTTLDASTYSVDPTGSVTLTVAPAKRAKVYADYQGVPQAYITFTAKTTLPDLSRGPFVGTLRLGIDRLGIDSQILATLVYSDAFPPTCDDFITYLANHYDYTVEDGEFFVVGDSAHTPIARGGGQMQAVLDDNRQFKLEATNTATRWTPGSQILFQQQSLQSIVPPGQFAFMGTLPDGALGEPYNYTFQTINGTAPITFAVISGIPPAAINTSTGAMHVDNFDALATYSWVIEATDADGRVVTENCILKVEVSQLQAYPSTHTPAWLVGTPISLAFNPYGGQRPYTYTVTGGSLLPGLSFVGDTLQGTVDGNPSTSNTLLQSIFTVTLTDNRDQTVVMNFNATVTDRSEAAIKASLCTKVVNWWDAQHSTTGTSLPLGSTLYDGTNRMNLTVGGADLATEATGRSGIPLALNFNAASYATALTTAYNLSDNFTLVSLVNFPTNSTTSTGQSLFGRGNNGDVGGYSLLVKETSAPIALYYVKQNGASTFAGFDVSVPPGVGNWTLIMVERYQGTPSLIVNAGSIENQQTDAGVLKPNNSQYFTLGADAVQSAASLFDGASAMNAVFNDKLWSDERKWLWNNGALKPFYALGFWPSVTLTPNQTVPAIWELDNPLSLSFTITGGTGIYFDVMFADGYTPPPGINVTFDSIHTVTLEGSPSVAGTYTVVLQVRSTDGSLSNYRVNAGTITVETTITPLVDLPMSGTEGATTVTDSTGRVWTVNGNAVIKTDVDPNGAMYFDGTASTYLSTPLTHDMDLMDVSFTAQIDIYPTQVTNNVAVSAHYGVFTPLVMGGDEDGDAAADGAGLFPYWGWTLPISGGAVPTELAVGSIPMAQNGWNTIKGVYTAGSTTITLFLNGQFCGMKNVGSGDVRSSVDTTADLILGSWQGGGFGTKTLLGYLRNFKWWQGIVYDPLTTASTSFGPYTPGVNGSYSVPILGGNGQYSATLVSGNTLPAGLTLSVSSNALVVAGTTTVAEGLYNATIVVQDTAGHLITTGYSFAVSYPLLTVTGSFGAAQIGTAYGASLTISGGNGPYSVALSNGTSLPPGLVGALDGDTYTITGTPTTIANTTLSLAFTSNDGQTKVVTQTFQVAGNFTILDATELGTYPGTIAPGSANAGTLSADALTLTGNGNGWSCVPALQAALKTSGKWYFEISHSNNDGTNGSGRMVNIVSKTWYDSNNSGWSYGADTTNYANCCFWESGDNYFNNSTHFNGAHPRGPNFQGAGVVLGVAVDAATGNVWVRTSSTGWYDGNLAAVGSGDPATGTSPWGVLNATSLAGGIFPDIVVSGSIYLTCNFGQNAFTYPVPMGFFPGWTNAVDDNATYPTLTASGSFEVSSIGEPYNSSVSCNGGSGIYAASITEGSLPDGLTATFSTELVGGQSRGTFTVSGVPSIAATAESFTVTFLSTDGQQHDAALNIAVIAPPAAITWNPDDKSSTIALSNGNLTYVGASGGGFIRSTTAKTQGKWYWECLIVGRIATAQDGPGIATDAATPSPLDASGLVHRYDGAAISNDAFIAGSTSSYDTGDVCMYAVDVEDGIASFWFGVNGVWSSAGDPTSSPGYAFTVNDGGVYAAGFPAGTNSSATARFNSASQTYSTPEGFTAWDSGYATFSADDHTSSTSITLSSDHLTATVSNVAADSSIYINGNVRLPRTSITYSNAVEFKVQALTSGWLYFGITGYEASDPDNPGAIGGYGSCYRSIGGICNNGCSGGLPTFAEGDVIGIAVSNAAPNGNVSFYKNGTAISAGPAESTLYSTGALDWTFYMALQATGGVGSAEVAVTTDPSDMLYFSSYGVAQGWADI